MKALKWKQSRLEERKRSRLEAGLPEAPDGRQPGSNQPGGASSRCEEGVFGVGGRVETVLASLAAKKRSPGARAPNKGRAKWPDVFDAPFRGLMPGMIKIMPSGDRSEPDSHAEDCGSGVGVSVDEVERWQAPWLAGLIDRVRRDGGGKAMSLDGGIRGRGFSKPPQIPDPARADGSKKEELSDLHHEILRFSEYVSLTPAEVEARENMKRSVKTAAVDAFGPGASIGFFGSYPRDERFGTNVTAAGENFSIFLSNVDIFFEPYGGGDGPGGAADAFEGGKGVSASPSLVEEGASRLAVQKLGAETGATKATASSVVTAAGRVKTPEMCTKKKLKEARSDLKRFGKELRKKPWITDYVFHKSASEGCVAPNIEGPGIACRDARSDIESDIVWGGHRQSEALVALIGPAYFAAMFPGTFLPLVKFLKVLMYQRNLDNSFTGGVGSFGLYVLVAAYLEACGGHGRRKCTHAGGPIVSSSTGAAGSASASGDLGKLLMGFLRRYASDSQDVLTSKIKLQVKTVKVKLKSAYRTDSAYQTFKEAFRLLSKPTPAISGSSSGEEDVALVQVHAGDPELQCSRGRRGSILGRVIWGSDLRKQREARLAAVGSAKASPAPQEPDPAWHRELEALSIPGPRGNTVTSIEARGLKRKNANNGGGGARAPKRKNANNGGGGARAPKRKNANNGGGEPRAPKRKNANNGSGEPRAPKRKNANNGGGEPRAPKRKNANNGGGGAKGGPAGAQGQRPGKKMTKAEKKAARMSPAVRAKAEAQRQSAAARMAAGHFRGYKLKTLRRLYPNGVDEALRQKEKKARKGGGPWGTRRIQIA